MKIIIITFFTLNCISSVTYAQFSEISLSGFGINNINKFTHKSDKGGPLQKFWSPSFSIFGEYKTTVFQPNIIFHSAIGVVGMYNNLSVVYQRQLCESCDAKKKISSSSGDLDFGLQLGLGKRFNIGKRKLEIIGGILLRRTVESFKGGRALVCNEVICTRILFNQYYTINGWLHPSVYSVVSWPIYSAKKNGLNIRFVFTLAKGLIPVYKFSSYVLLVQENVEYNYELENKGTYFGIGLSFNRQKY